MKSSSVFFYEMRYVSCLWSVNVRSRREMCSTRLYDGVLGINIAESGSSSCEEPRRSLRV